MCLLGLLGGIFAACAIILFRLAIENLQLIYLTEHDNFATADETVRFALPLIGALVIVGIAKLTGYKHYRLGIPFVIHRIKKFYGVMPFRTSINQVFGGIFALACGFSVGREGPSVHIGAASSSWFGNWLKLPNNSIRILSGCGIAAGIAASFNTPLAAVIFVMELVFREYKIHIFIPVMLAAVAGDVLSRMALGLSNDFAHLKFVQLEHNQLWFLVVFGVAIGLFAYVFNNQLIKTMTTFRPVSMLKRLMLAGLLTAVVGYFIPQAMGTGNAALSSSILEAQNFQFLVMLLVAKFFLFSIAIGLGVPGGVIGPIHVVGALLGALAVGPFMLISDDAHQYTGTFALLGMAGFMSAALNAPMTALVTILEMANTTDIVMPAMIVIVSAFIMSTQVLRNRSLFVMQLIYQKLPYLVSPADEELQRVGIIAMMDKEFELFNDAQEERLLGFLENNPTHPVVQKRDYALDIEYYLVSYDYSLDPHSTSPLTYSRMEGITTQCTLAEAYKILHGKYNSAVYVYEDSPENIKGVLTYSMLREFWTKETV